ncbi:MULTISPECIES: DUF6635 family protein [unclassified Paracoccus (in: a-proteobacteria)]|uniref:DUF6635 family protein n=1 Tax=unclassified Paracoccus (in: a-proteobacteria) TaxID=2688777 RepID=UPI0016036404|nr:MULTISPECIES: DUF6635 family protein [unclassified Paracoccus (in: a-proteobacteria)]MBB1493187.1 hypothetical protein [Paracoccus sp. MC1854]MBB1499451.1 hypothetical protein [Paracoccus sp. MC1862]QQO45116.1 hypothetical protein JGR78_01550 [Paracoccus sp. MC1862]
MQHNSTDKPRDAEIRRFVRATYGVKGTLTLHRAALPWDMVRAPVNVMLSPMFLLIKLSARLADLCRLRWLGRWLATRRIFLTSDLSRQLESNLRGFFAQLDQRGISPAASDDEIDAAISSYAETRNAVAEITTSLIVVLAGLLIFHRVTPGVISLAGPVAHLRAQAQAIEDFALGSWIGRMWYGAFPTELSTAELFFAGLFLTGAASLVTTFAGLLADPIQLWTGIHRRRLSRMLERLDRKHAPPALEREHLLARAGDLGDVAAWLWRSWR